MSIETFKLKSKTGMELHVLDYGATITSLKIPVEDKLIDVVLGFDTPEDYVRSFELGHSPYFGAIVGRFAGRIRNGEFEVNGRKVQLEKNFGNHHIHGGSHGLSRKKWEVKSIIDSDEPSITFTVSSTPDEDGFPGEVTVEVTYTLTQNNELDIKYKATTTEDTLLNLTQHSYFNLEGHGSDVLNQLLKLNSNQVLETDSNNIPTGELISLHNHEFDFSNLKPVPSQIDDAFVLDTENDLAAELYSPNTNLKLKVFTDQPCVLVYVGGEVDSKLTPKEKLSYHKTSGICFETQAFPDAPNHEHFPSAFLKKEETYKQYTVFSFEHIKNDYRSK
jgi:aldose 1-epimerase